MAYAARRYKKGQSGAAVEYISRTQAIKKLQISLNDFRRLCILKGIYPREAPKALKKKKTQTFYLTKDIMFLAHDPLLPKLRERRAFYKKIKRAKGRKDYNHLEHLERNVPSYTLDHLIRERYPTFVDAVRDMDDALRLMALFANMPRTALIDQPSIDESAYMLQEFRYYVIKAQALRKVFVSIKGIYYQAIVQGQPVVWLEPLKFTPLAEFPKDFDCKVMLTFLEFYRTFMGFVLFKLYNSLGLTYPPTRDQRMLQAGVFGVDATLAESFPTAPTGDDTKAEVSDQVMQRLAGLKEKLKNVPAEESDEAFEEGEEEDQDEQVLLGSGEDNGQGESKRSPVSVDSEKTKYEEYLSLFKGCHFWLSRETARESLHFVILCFGGKVSYEERGDARSDESITHEIVDRPGQQRRFLSREYLQPQWVYDCINCGMLLPTGQYLVGAKLPPHLSPFVDDAEEGYIPQRRVELNQIMGIETLGREDVTIAPSLTEDEELRRMEKEYTAGVAKETAQNQGEPEEAPGSPESNRSSQEEPSEDLLEEERSKVMMSTKQKRKYHGATKKERHKERKAKKLKERRERLEEKSKKRSVT